MLEWLKLQVFIQKNPSQHSADLDMLEEEPTIKPKFINPANNERKLIECIRVDGAADVGPIHDKVQFIWTERHLKSTIACLVTTRNNGSSFLIELNYKVAA